MQSAPANHPLTGELTIYRAAEVKTQLMALLDSQSNVELDLSEVSEIDTSGVQLLLAAAAEAARRQIRLAFRGPSPAVVEACRLYRIDLLAV